MDRELHEIDFFDPEVVECPFAYYQKARTQAPILKLVLPETGTPIFLVTRYNDVVDVLKDHALFSSRFMNPVGRDKADPDIEAIYDKGWPWVDTLLTSDPPNHRRYRTLVNRAFTAKRVRALEPYIENLAHELIDTFVNDGRCDFVSAFARPLPLQVIADQFGVPHEDLPAFKRWSDSFVARLGGLVSKDEELACARDVVALQTYLKDRIDERRETPKDDIMSDLVHAQAEEEAALSDKELINMLQQLLVAGNETTANTLAGGLMQLLQEPSQMKAVCHDQDLISGLVEESLRTVTAQAGMWRIATQDTTLSGVKIPSGSTLLLRYDSADRDPEQFSQPETFNIRRPNGSSHLAFGHGIHFCVGALLARKELEVGFKAILARLDDIRLTADNDFSHQPNMMMRGLKRLNLTFKPKQT